MTDKTFHVFRAADGAWAVQRAGTKPVGFRTRVEALKSARSKARKRNQAQVVVHLDDGTFAVDYMKGLPAVQAPPPKKHHRHGGHFEGDLGFRSEASWKRLTLAAQLRPNDVFINCPFGSAFKPILRRLSLLLAPWALSRVVRSKSMTPANCV